MNSCLKKAKRPFTIFEMILVISILMVIAGWISSYSAKMVSFYGASHDRKKIREELSFLQQISQLYQINVECNFHQLQKGLHLEKNFKGGIFPSQTEMRNNVLRFKYAKLNFDHVKIRFQKGMVIVAPRGAQITTFEGSDTLDDLFSLCFYQ